MSILIRKSNEQNPLIFHQNVNFISEEFIELIKETIETIKKQDELKLELEQKEKEVAKNKIKSKKLISEQKSIDAEIQVILNSKTLFYSTTSSCFESQTITKANNSLNELNEKLKQMDFKVLQVMSQIKYNSKAIVSITKELKELEQKVQLLKNLVSVEYKKVNWVKITSSVACFSGMFANVKNEKLRILLNKVVRKNFDIEKLVIGMVQKITTKILYDKTNQSLYELLKQTIILNNMNNLIYNFIFELTLRDNILEETAYLLCQLYDFLEVIENYAKCSLNQNRKIDITSSVARIKSISELNKKRVIKNYRPKIFYKKKLKAYDLDSNVITNIINQMHAYLVPACTSKQNKTKTYFIY